MIVDILKYYFLYTIYTNTSFLEYTLAIFFSSKLLNFPEVISVISGVVKSFPVNQLFWRIAPPRVSSVWTFWFKNRKDRNSIPVKIYCPEAFASNINDTKALEKVFVNFGQCSHEPWTSLKIRQHFLRKKNWKLYYEMKTTTFSHLMSLFTFNNINAFVVLTEISGNLPVSSITPVSQHSDL